MAKENYDCHGWATQYGVLCGDGRTIMHGAFADQDGATVPLIWNHNHDDPADVLGHALLEARPEGMYTYCKFNDTKNGRTAKELVKNQDITSFSIYANKLQYKGDRRSGNVQHGMIREVSLVLAGANPKAGIEPELLHGEESEDAAFICCADENTAFCESLEHDDTKPAEEKPSEEKPAEEAKKPEDEETVQDVFDSMTDRQKKVAYAAIAVAVDAAKNNDEAKHNDEEDGNMKENIFDKGSAQHEDVLTHSDIETIFDTAKKGRLTLKEACDDFLSHKANYGIDNIGELFPDYKELNNPPKFIDRDQTWVGKVMNGVKHLPFSRVKTSFADITADDARARGYTKGKKKVEEVITLAKRTTDPQTVYKKQKLDRDDVLDITDFGVVAWIKNEMRGKLDEELARAILIGDGRDPSSDDKIQEQHIRPIWTDDALFTIKREITEGATAAVTAENMMDDAIRARKEYKGSGNPVLFTTEDVLAEMLLLKDKNGRRIYTSVNDLATAMRASSIITVPQMEGLTRSTTAGKTTDTYTLYGIMVNLADYSVGADKGGSVNMFDDFDIDYNQYKYLIETRCSGALTVPKSAIVFETKESVTTE